MSTISEMTYEQAKNQKVLTELFEGALRVRLTHRIPSEGYIVLVLSNGHVYKWDWNNNMNRVDSLQYEEQGVGF